MLAGLMEGPMNVKPTVKRLLRPFNLAMTAHIYGATFKVPIMRGVGGSHRRGSEPWMTDAFRQLFRLAGRSGLIDVGVNIGQTLLKLRSVDRTCRYVGFEPNPFCIQFVNEIIALNQFEDCVLLPVALSTGAGLIEFIADSEADSAASMMQDLRPGKTGLRKQYIATLVFDDVSPQLDVDGIPVVKIDVEGAELEVLAGMRQFLGRSRPSVLCEVLHAHSSGQIDLMHGRNRRLMALLHDAGYAVHRIVKDAAQARVAALEPVAAFPDEVFDFRISPQVCDYLFSPRERVVDTLAMFSGASRAG
jgi:FkbM family methyltransferase